MSLIRGVEQTQFVSKAKYSVTAKYIVLTFSARSKLKVKRIIAKNFNWNITKHPNRFRQRINSGGIFFDTFKTMSLIFFYTFRTFAINSQRQIKKLTTQRLTYIVNTVNAIMYLTCVLSLKLNKWVFRKSMFWICRGGSQFLRQDGGPY